jgi:hypothetical protein
MTDPRPMTVEQRFQEVAAILARAMLRILVQQSGDSSKNSLDVAEDSRLTVRVG